MCTICQRARSPACIRGGYMWQTTSDAYSPGKFFSRSKTSENHHWNENSPCGVQIIIPSRVWISLWTCSPIWWTCSQLITGFETLSTCYVLVSWNIFNSAFVHAQHRRFLGGDDDSELVITAKPPLFLTFATKFLNPDSNIAEDETVVAAAKLFKGSMYKLNARKFVDKTSVPQGLFLVSNFAHNVTHYLWNY